MAAKLRSASNSLNSIVEDLNKDRVNGVMPDVTSKAVSKEEAARDEEESKSK